MGSSELLSKLMFPFAALLRFFEARMALTELAVMAAQHDTDGIDVYFMEETTKNGTNLRVND